MTRKQHLTWIYKRMINVHNENENYDYMLRFKEIIDGIDGIDEIDDRQKAATDRKRLPQLRGRGRYG